MLPSSAGAGSVAVCSSVTAAVIDVLAWVTSIASKLKPPVSETKRIV